MFIVVFVIMLPIYLKTKDAVLAWKAGIAWAFIIGLIVIVGAFVGPYIRKYAPRAAQSRNRLRIADSITSPILSLQGWQGLRSSVTPVRRQHCRSRTGVTEYRTPCHPREFLTESSSVSY